MVRLEAALQGLEDARGKLERTAGRVAKSGSFDFSAPPSADDVDLSAEAASWIEARNQYLLNLRTLKTADDLNRHTVDLLG
jgi:hypothetical protein